MKIILNLDRVKRQIKQQLDDLKRFSEKRLQDAMSQDHDINDLVERARKFVKDESVISEVLSDPENNYFDLEYALSDASENADPVQWNEISKLRDDIDSWGHRRHHKLTEVNYDQEFVRICNELDEKFEPVKEQILKATDVPNFPDIDSVVITPSGASDTEIGEINSFLVDIGPLSFTCFLEDGKVAQVDDVLDQADIDDSYDETSEQSQKESLAYFILVKELQSPGSSQKGKNLKLYTARPIKDRDFYLKSNFLPQGVYLANSLSHVEGIAVDLGADEVRDVWSVFINSSALNEVGAGAGVRYYTVIKQAPAKMTLLSAGHSLKPKEPKY